MTDDGGLDRVDPEVAALIEAEEGRRVTTIDLIASESEPSPPILEALGLVFAAKTAEGYPGRRYHRGTVHADELEALAISRATALQRLAAYDLSSIELSRLSGADPSAALEHAVPASPGVAVGRAALDAEIARRMAGGGEPVVLLRHEAATADLPGMAVAAGILTAVGSRTSHAAVVARHLGKVCLVGCTGLRFDWERRRFQLGGQWLSEGDFLSLDGNEGAVYRGQLPVRRERPEAELAKVAGWRAEAGSTTSPGSASLCPGQ